jgi:very-short-patch-repair endonuclease
MEQVIVQPRSVWDLVRRQHGVVTRGQLLELGYRPDEIDSRIRRGRLHRVWRGVYAAGRPALTQHGHWLAAVLCCGPEAALSHASAAALWQIRAARADPIHVSVPIRFKHRQRGIVVHRRLSFEATTHEGIPVTTPICTLVDMAATLTRDQLEAAVNEADSLGLVDPEQLRAALDGVGPRPGVRGLRRLLDRHTFVLTDSALERLFLPLARTAGLSRPLTGEWVNGFKVDFYWPDLGLVVEVDGLRYHRTPAKQADDRRRDQAHTATGLTTLRFTHAQVQFEPAHVVATLRVIERRLSGRTPAG